MTARSGASPVRQGEAAGGAVPAVPVLAVVGVGLIGGSFAAALRRAGHVGRVLGVGRQPAALARAQALGLIDEAVTLEQAGRQADFLMLATPVSSLGGILAGLAPVLREDAVVTDAGSTKQDVAAAARAMLGARIGQFVPGHPIAGSDAAGPDAAEAGLYQDRNVILTPLPENDEARLQRVALAWQACGARVRTMSAADHDAVLASVSHLPHWLSALYMAQVAAAPDAAVRLALAGTGFRDFTRIAAGSPEVWRDIFLSNRQAMQNELSALRAVLDRAERALAEGDGQALQALLEQACQARRDWRLGDRP